jgi:hypothetical protein
MISYRKESHISIVFCIYTAAGQFVGYFFGQRIDEQGIFKDQEKSGEMTCGEIYQMETSAASALFTADDFAILAQ